jgi:hypothetical protein
MVMTPVPHMSELRASVRQCRFLPDSGDDRAHGLVRDIKVASHTSQSVALDLIGNLKPSLPRDTWSLGYCGIPPEPRSSSRLQDSLSVEKRDQRQCHHVYLA